MQQLIGYNTFEELRHAARSGAVELLSAKTARDVAYRIADIGSRFGIDEEFRPHSERTALVGHLTGELKSFDAVVDLVHETFIEHLFDKGLTVAVDQSLRIAIFHGFATGKEMKSKGKK